MLCCPRQLNNTRLSERFVPNKQAVSHGVGLRLNPLFFLAVSTVREEFIVDKIVTKTYKPQKSEHPIWKQTKCVVVRYYQFDVSKENYANRQLHGIPTILSRHEEECIKTTFGDTLHTSCSYHWHGYNPMPVAGWFHGLPKQKMFKWCEEHGLTNPTLVREFVKITYEDVSDDKTIF